MRASDVPGIGTRKSRLVMSQPAATAQLLAGRRRSYFRKRVAIQNVRHSKSAILKLPNLSCDFKLAM